jgi:SP family arabinose:H+ symporter-like MFS transporter
MDSNPYESPENIDSSAIGSPTPNGRGLGYIAAVCFVTTIGGFLFGYDTAVISGGIDFIERQFALSPDMKGWVVASALLGCIVGSACSGAMADRFGRKSVLLLSSALLLISAVGSMLPQSAVQLVVARMIGGLGIGITATASPMYMSEVSPAHFRGRMVSLYQLAITLGIVAAFTVNAVLLQYAAARSGAAGSGFWHWIAVAEVWRAMFGAGAIPAALYVLLLGFIPESPRWLIGQGHVAEARSVMRHTMTEAEMERAVADVSDALSHESNSVFELFQPGLRRALVLGVLLALFSQFSGINAVMYFGPTILKNVGFAAGGAMGGAILVGIINCIFTLVAIWKVDSFGRRPLLLVGVSGVFVSLAAAAALFAMPGVDNAWKLVPLLFFCACFSFSYGPVCWVVIGEIFPTRYRGRAVSVATAAIWLGAFAVSQLFPRMLQHLQASGAFAVYAALTAVAVVFIWKALPETKGRTLEEIERSWTGDPG